MKGRKNKILQDEIDKIKAMQTDMVELIAIWIGGAIRISPGNLIIINDNGNIAKDGDFVTHRCIGCFGTLADTKHSVMVVDIITNEPSVIEL